VRLRKKKRPGGQFMEPSRVKKKEGKNRGGEKGKGEN